MSDFFRQLEIFSHRYFDHLGIEERQSPWGPSDYDLGCPRGAVVHYTADANLDAVVKWFMREKYQSHVSANFVVADGLLSAAAGLVADLPAVAALPATIIQCAPLDTPTWHARGISSMLMGIELVNAGELRRDAAGMYFSHWRRDHSEANPEWTEPWIHPSKVPVPAWGRYWEPYSKEQLHALILLLREVDQVRDISPEWVVGHECVQDNKRDPGPAFPWQPVRASIFGGTCGWIADYQPGGESSIRGELVRAFYQLDHDPDQPVTSREAWVYFHDALRRLVSSPEDPFGVVGKVALALLGYHIPAPLNFELRDPEKTAIWAFQKMMGLKPDRIPGSRTRRALLDRLAAQGIL